MTERDKEIIKAVWEYKALTAPQIVTLLFPLTQGGPSITRGKPGSLRGRMNQCKLRLKKLWENGYLWRGEQLTTHSKGRKPFVYRIDQAGAKLLPELLSVDADEVNWSPKQRRLPTPHDLQTTDIIIALIAASMQHGFEVTQFVDDHTLRSHHATDLVTVTGDRGATYRAAVKPDGYLKLWNGDRHFHFFIECDRGNTVGAYADEIKSYYKRDWKKKIKTYLAYYNSGLYRKRYHTKSLRILTVTTSLQRMQTILRVAETTNAGNRFWFTTFDQLNYEAAFTEPIWYISGTNEVSPLFFPRHFPG